MSNVKAALLVKALPSSFCVRHSVSECEKQMPFLSNTTKTQVHVWDAQRHTGPDVLLVLP